MESVSKLLELQKEAEHHMSVMEGMMNEGKSEAEILEYSKNLISVNEQIDPLINKSVNEFQSSVKKIKSRRKLLTTTAMLCGVLSIIIVIAKIVFEV